MECVKEGCGYHSVTSAHEDIAIDNNGTWSDAYIFGDDDDRTWNFIGCTFAADVQNTRYDAAPLLQLNSANGRIIVDDAIQRVLHFNVDPAAIQAALKPGCYVYDLVMIDGSNPPIRTPLMHGWLEVNQGVTYP